MITMITIISRLPMHRGSMAWNSNICFLPTASLFLPVTTHWLKNILPGFPVIVFIQQMMKEPQTNKIRLAKEFVKFNERCFVRLLGDMRSYNFVVDITPDIEDYQYRIRAIDFDQQSYEGRKNLISAAILQRKLSLCRSFDETPQQSNPLRNTRQKKER